MEPDARRDLERIEDILQAAADIAGFCRDLDRSRLEADKTLRYALLHALSIIGEAANALSPELRSRHNAIPWRRIIGFRHRVIHGYHALDLDLVFEIVVVMVPQLRLQIEALRAVEFSSD